MGNPKDAKPYTIRMAEWTKNDFKAIADKEGLTMGELIQRFVKLYEIHEKELMIKNHKEIFGDADATLAGEGKIITTEEAWDMLFGEKKREEARANAKSKSLRDFLGGD